MDKKVLIMLVGVPGSGKSTWTKQMDELVGFSPLDLVVLSTDDYIEEKAKQEGKTYTEVFKKYISDAEKDMLRKLGEAVEKNKNIVWDQTNLTKKTRAKKLAMFPPNYCKIAIVFCTPEEEVRRRLKNRAEETGKYISPEIMSSMFKNFELPEKSEGFDDIVRLLA